MSSNNKNIFTVKAGDLDVHSPKTINNLFNQSWLVKKSHFLCVFEPCNRNSNNKFDVKILKFFECLFYKLLLTLFYLNTSIKIL